MTALRPHTRSLRADITRLAGTMPGPMLARALGCEYSTLRTIASEVGVSIRFDPARSALVEIKCVVAADVAAKLSTEASARERKADDLGGEIISAAVRDGIVGAVLGDR